MTTTNGTIDSKNVLTPWQVKASELIKNIPLDVIGCRNGGPTLSTRPDNIYWKQDTRNKAVF